MLIRHFSIAYNLRRDDISVWVVGRFYTLCFQNHLYCTCISYGFVHLILFVWKMQENLGEQKRKTIGKFSKSVREQFRNSQA